jgi:glycosyltransferase involved in cell wall biosynthesis
MSFELLPSLPEHLERPLWSVIIPAYNKAEFIEQTINSVVSQLPVPGGIQIEVIDDCSTDDTEEIVKKYEILGVTYYKQQNNVGHIKNYETGLLRSKGKLIHILHGDDYVKPGFYQQFTLFFEEFPEVGAAFCRNDFVDEKGTFIDGSAILQESSGVYKNFFNEITQQQLLQTPTMVVKREVYEKVGMFNHKLKVSQSEDWEMWARMGKSFPVGFINSVLAGYRVHSNSVSGNFLLSGKYITDYRQTIAIINSYIGDKKLKKANKKKAYINMVTAGTNKAILLLSYNNKKAARTLLESLIMLSGNIRVNLRLIKWYLKSI